MDIIKIKEETRKEVWDLYVECEHEIYALKSFVANEIPISKETFVSMRDVKNSLITHIQEAYNLLKDEENIIRIKNS